mmetsp:Transcript_35298/g.112304  ORF Transcript_35298/g.112304 Transcript_35298/m.112304 type:complete len:206 (-) Transcript_35298:660-1277(-)
MVFALCLLDEVRCIDQRRCTRRGRLWREAWTERVLLGLGLALEVAAQEAREHAQQHDAREVAVLRLLVPAIELGVVQPEGQGRVPGVPRKRVEEPGALRQLLHELPLERHGLPQLHGLVQDLLAHALELQPREVPDLRDLVLGEVLLDGRKLPHHEAEVQHPVLVHLGQCELRWRHQVDFDLAVEPQAIHLRVHGATVEEVAQQR